MFAIWSQLSENQGLHLALAGVLIVFAALALVSLCISVLPKLLRVVGPVLDRLEGGKASGVDVEAAAAAAAMHAHLNRMEK